MTPNSPLERYLADLKRPGFVEDPAQRRAVETLERIHAELISRPARTRLLARLRRSTSWPPVNGAYFWGGVGRGKTYLMDCFYETLETPHKQRLHFHRFMREVHLRIRALGHASDPLALIADELAREVRVLCFDEFFVSDVADAMILGRLMNKLFEHGITLIATSNIPPDLLYQHGLQREAFLPAIASLKNHCAVIEVDGGTDYRLRLLEQAHMYHLSSEPRTEGILDQTFRDIAPDAAHPEHSIEINGRDIRVRKHADGIAWFEFDAVCRGPRAAADYIELARLFSTVMLSGVPQMTWETENEARRFLHLVDEFYDRRVKLMIAADVPMQQLYAGQKLTFEYARVLSRLQEMQSHDYLAEPHKP